MGDRGFLMSKTVRSVLVARLATFVVVPIASAALTRASKVATL